MPSTRGYSTDAAFDPNAVAALLAVRALLGKLREKKVLNDADIARFWPDWKQRARAEILMSRQDAKDRNLASQ